jgi:hypothetical protein
VPPKAEARFFDADAIAEAFGGILGPLPPIPDSDPDPFVSRASVFAENRVSYSPQTRRLEQIRRIELRRRSRRRDARRPQRVRFSRRLAAGVRCDWGRRHQTVRAWTPFEDVAGLAIERQC